MHSITEREDVKREIAAIEVTTDTLTGRGGLNLFVRYLRGIQIFPYLEQVFGSLRKNRKGSRVSEVFKQIFCFFLDGTSRHIVAFDALSADAGYAAAIETAEEEICSSHTIKRFFKAFSMPRVWLFRSVLLQLFLWRLRIEKPEVIVLGLDTMVMDNDEAEVRHGVQPTYKKVKGFQPLQMTWGRMVIDALFRGGKKHGNHGEGVERMVTHMVGQIRRYYRADVPIIIRQDSGFFDQDLFACYERLGVGYIGGGKLYDDLKEYISAQGKDGWGRLEKEKGIWEFVEFGDQRESWKRFRRAIFCRPVAEEEGQMLLEFARPDTVLYTNLGMGQAIDEQLRRAGRSEWFRPERAIITYHYRGNDELVHRALKEFGSETLPFKRFVPNAGFYYCLLVAFFLYESFKEDVCQAVVPVSAYATTLRRKVIDFAAKIVRHGGKIIMKVTEATWRQLRIYELWERSGAPVPLVWT